MQPSAPITPVPTSTSNSHSRRPRFLTQTASGRVVLALVALAALSTGTLWYTRYRGTGWSQTFNVVLWYRRSRGEDLYRTADAMLLHGSRKLPEVALTFDDGPHPRSRPLILDTLKRYGARATFFDVGVNMERHPDLLRRTLAENHEVANHSDHHLRLPDLSPSERHREINDPDITFCAITNRHLRLFRPPGMRYNAAVLADTRNLGYVVVSYTTAAKDADAADPAPAKVIADRTLSRIENGSILLLHDYPGTADALPTILETLRARGYRCVTVSEMLDHLPEPVHSEARKQLVATP
jgi:peptidoglycan/xylan/chitin deacetylase (PgdA/CDA1 family)